MTNNISRKTKKIGHRANTIGPRRRRRGRRLGGEGIGKLFAGAALVSLLRIFLLNASKDFYQRELVERTGERLFLVQTALRRLIDAGLVIDVVRGNRKYYRANESHPAFSDLKSLIFKTVGLGDALRSELKKLRGKVIVAFVYGSIARGDETEKSDIDVMLMGEISSREVSAALAPVKRLLNREINPSVYTAKELIRKLKEKQPFIREVISGPKIFLVGDEDVLKTIIGRRSA